MTQEEPIRENTQATQANQRRTRSRVYGETTNSVTKLNNKFNNYNETRLVYYCCTWVRSYTKMIYLSNEIYNVKLQAELL